VTRVDTDLSRIPPDQEKEMDGPWSACDPAKLLEYDGQIAHDLDLEYSGKILEEFAGDIL